MTSNQTKLNWTFSLAIRLNVLLVRWLAGCRCRCSHNTAAHSSPYSSHTATAIDERICSARARSQRHDTRRAKCLCLFSAFFPSFRRASVPFSPTQPDRSGRIACLFFFLFVHFSRFGFGVESNMNRDFFDSLVFSLCACALTRPGVCVRENMHVHGRHWAF